VQPAHPYAGKGDADGDVAEARRCGKGRRQVVERHRGREHDADDPERARMGEPVRYAGTSQRPLCCLDAAEGQERESRPFEPIDITVNATTQAFAVWPWPASTTASRSRANRRPSSGFNIC
jgi:hypothetical protein